MDRSKTTLSEDVCKDLSASQCTLYKNVGDPWQDPTDFHSKEKAFTCPPEEINEEIATERKNIENFKWQENGPARDSSSCYQDSDGYCSNSSCYKKDDGLCSRSKRKNDEKFIKHTYLKTVCL